MRLKEIQYEEGLYADKVTLTIFRKDREPVLKMLEKVNGKDAEFSITPHREKRSMDANRYMWALIDQIADMTHEKREDIYRNAIKENGVYDDMAVLDKAVNDFRRRWAANGVGYFSEIFPSKLEGCVRVRAYSGSSVYDSKQMSRLIDAVVYSAADLGIETKTPDELAELKSKWGQE